MSKVACPPATPASAAGGTTTAAFPATMMPPVAAETLAVMGAGAFAVSTPGSIGGAAGGALTVPRVVGMLTLVLAGRSETPVPAEAVPTTWTPPLAELVELVVTTTPPLAPVLAGAVVVVVVVALDVPPPPPEDVVLVAVVVLSATPIPTGVEANRPDVKPCANATYTPEVAPAGTVNEALMVPLPLAVTGEAVEVESRPGARTDSPGTKPEPVTVIVAPAATLLLGLSEIEGE